jgi:hypothetical protein
MTDGNDSHWLTAERATAYARLSLVAFVLLWLAILTLRETLVGPRDLSLELDFMAFWGASHLALTGHAADAYDMHKLLTA